jgi:penicillin-binding protein 1A
MLAGLPKAPSAYNPINNPKRATIRQQYIIDRMLENGFITEEQRDEAKAEKLRIRPATNRVHAEYVAEMARQLIFSQYGDEAYTRGLNVYLTLNSAEQNAPTARCAAASWTTSSARSTAARRPMSTCPPTQGTGRPHRRGPGRPSRQRRLLAAVVLEATRRRSPPCCRAARHHHHRRWPQAGHLRPVRQGQPQDRSAAAPSSASSRGQKDGWTITQLPEVEGAFVAWTRATAPCALVGGFDFNKNKFNHVTQAWRQPGSSFKPFIYSAALEKGFTPATVVNDAPLFFDAGTTGSQPWEPKNYDGKFDGPMTLRTALAKSKNMVSIRVLQAIGVRYAQDWITASASRPRSTRLPDDGAGRRLGHADADGPGYSVFANGGYRVNPADRRITDNKGKVLTRPARPLTDDARAIEPRNAFMMTACCRSGARGTAPRRPRSSAPTCTARPAPPTTRWTPGSPASRSLAPSSGSATTAAQARRPRDRRRPEPAGLDRVHAPRSRASR